MSPCQKINICIDRDPNIAVLALPERLIHIIEKPNDICKTPACEEWAALILNDMDDTVDPCDDFYRFSCGGFLNKTSIPDSEGEVDYFTFLNDKIMQQMWDVIKEPISVDPKYVKNMKNLYESCMNEAAIEKRALKPLQEILKTLGGWPVLEGRDWDEASFDWIKSIHRFRQTGFPINYFLSLDVGEDLEDNTKKVLLLDEPLLTFSRNELSNRINNTNVSEYYRLMVDIAEMLGASRYDAIAELNESLEFEMALVEITMSELDLNMTRYYDMTVGELYGNYTDVLWIEYINGITAPYVTIDENERIVVVVPEFLSEFVKLMNATSKRVQANYVMWRAVKDSLMYLNRKVLERLQYRKVQEKVIESQLRWKKCVEQFIEYIPAQAMYAEKYGHEGAPDEITEIINAITLEFRKLTEMADWMDDKTKKNVLEKTAGIKFYVGYPDDLFNKTAIEEAYHKLELDDENFFENSFTIRRYNLDQKFSEFREPNNEDDWLDYTKILEANAFYDPNTNKIQIPAGILHGIFYNDSRPRYMNYAAIGSIIGHEVTHAFNYEGSEIHNFENIEYWMPLSGNKEYHLKAQCIIDQYSNFTIPGIEAKLNGSKTQIENTADNNGFKLAYLAYTQWLRRHGEEQCLPGLHFNSQQMFWISAANSLCSKYRLEYMQWKMAHDVHSPLEFQILGSLRNRPEFAKDFNCSAESRMNPKDKCILW